MTDTLEPVTVADVERQKLQKHFGRFDILFFLVCTIVGVDTIATVAAGRRRGLHLDDDLRGRLLHPAGPAVLRARHGLPAGRRALLLDPAGLRAPSRGGEQLPVLDHQPGVDRRHARHLLHRRRRGVLQQREHRAHRGVLHHHAGLRLGVHRGRDHLVQRGQVGAHGRGLRPVHPARPVHDHRHHLRDQARRPRPGRGELLADGRRLRAPHRRAAVQLRRLRAAQQRRARR